MVSGPGQKPPSDEQRPSANVRQIVQFVRKEPDDWAEESLLEPLAVIWRQKILVAMRFSNTLYFALCAEKCFASSGLPAFHLVGLK